MQNLKTALNYLTFKSNLIYVAMNCKGSFEFTGKLRFLNRVKCLMWRTGEATMTAQNISFPVANNQK